MAAEAAEREKERAVEQSWPRQRRQEQGVRAKQGWLVGGFCCLAWRQQAASSGCGVVWQELRWKAASVEAQGSGD